MLNLKIWFLPSNFENKGLFLLHSSGAKYVLLFQDDVIRCKHFPCYWPFKWGINRSIVDSPHKGQWCGALMFSVMPAWPKEWTNNRDASDLRRHHGRCDVTVMQWFGIVLICMTLIAYFSCWNEFKFKTTSQWLQKLSYCYFYTHILSIGANLFLYYSHVDQNPCHS